MRVFTLCLLIIKSFGLWMLVGFVNQFLTLLGNLVDFAKMDTEAGSIAFYLAILVFILFLYLGFIYLLIFKAPVVIHKFKLTEFFPDELMSFHIDPKTVIIIVISLLAGILILDHFPAFVKLSFYQFQMSEIFRQNPDASSIIYHLVATILAIIVLAYAKPIAGFFYNHDRVHEVEESSNMDIKDRLN